LPRITGGCALFDSEGRYASHLPCAKWRKDQVVHGEAHAFDKMSDAELRQYVVEEAKALGLGTPVPQLRLNGTKH
jgi:hypothetical protein